MRARIRLSVALAVGAVVMSAGSSIAASPAGAHPSRAELSATLEGHAIPLTAVAALPCHDFEYPIIRCFRSADGLLAAVASHAGYDPRTGTSLAVASTGYVTAYDQFNYGGSNPKVLSTDQAWLALIGWNDVTSSFKSFGARGRWWEHSPSGGLVYSYGTTTQVPVLSSTYNNKFSAFEID
jgi:hypothetical protein